MNILILEDDINLNKGISISLSDDGYIILNAYCIEEALEIIKSNKIDLGLVDLNLPDGDGIDFIKKSRELGFIFPIIILSANNLESDIILGLRMGADDYITKPFSLMVLREKVKTMLRRLNIDENNLYIDDSMNFDFKNLRFLVDGKEINLSKTEIKLLQILTENKGRIVKKEYLIDRIWDEESYVDNNALSVAVNRLKGKIKYKNKIKNEYGVGYIWSI